MSKISSKFNHHTRNVLKRHGSSLAIAISLGVVQSAGVQAHAQTTFEIFDTQTDGSLGVVANNATVNSAVTEGRRITFTATPSGSIATDVASAQLTWNGGATRTENVVPYALFGDINGNFNGGVFLSAGTYTVRARFFAERGGNDSLLADETLTFTIEDGPASPPPPPPHLLFIR